VAGARAFAARLGTELKLGARHFNVCLVDDDAIRELNGAFRNKPYATDVLSFAWTGAGNGGALGGRGRAKVGKNQLSSAALPPALRKGSAFPAGRKKTDTLSFRSGKAEPFRKAGGRAALVELDFFTASGPQAPAAADREFAAFLGDVVISVETAQRNACFEGHSTAAEIRWLILHGVLHLLGMDHETDHGEMESRELDLRARLGLNGPQGVKETSKRRRSGLSRAQEADSSGRKSSGPRNDGRAAGSVEI